MKNDVKERQMTKLVSLFFSMLSISAFTFGGGFVIIGMMHKKYCEELGWIGEDEVLEMSAIAQSTPGSLAINSAVILGYRICGLAGALLSAIAMIIPPLAMISIVSVFYRAFSDNQLVHTALRVMRAGVGAVIVDVVLDLLKHMLVSKNIFHLILMIVAFMMSYVFGVSAISVILLFLVIGMIFAIKEKQRVS